MHSNMLRMETLRRLGGWSEWLLWLECISPKSCVGNNS
jgi:hypothetical protein